jgi:tetratricopeptide (TPR) repeat protein
LQSGGFATILLVKEPILASNDQMQILNLMQASWPAGDKVTFQEARSRLKEDELSIENRQLIHFYFVLYALNVDDKADALHQMSFLDGKRALDELLIIYRTGVLSDKLQPDSLAIIQVRENLRRTLEPALETQLAGPVKTYLLAFADSLGIDNIPQVADTLAYACVKWFYDNNRKTYDTYIYLVQHYYKTRQETLQEAVLNEALNVFPEDASLLNWLGYSYVVKGTKLDEAEALIRRALQLSPDNAFYLDSLAWLYYTKNDFQTALQLMEIPMQLEDIPGEISLHYALIQLALNNTEAGVDYLNYTVNSNNDPDSVAKALQLLQQMGRR